MKLRKLQEVLARLRCGWRWCLVGLALLLPLCFFGRVAPAAAVSSQAYAQLRLLVEALYEIDQRYVTEKKERDLIYGAIRGLMASLDANSSFLTPAEYQESLHERAPVEADAGLELSVKDNLLTIIAALEGGPAWQAGLRPDDHILKINNQSTRAMTAIEAAKKLQAPPGTKVKLQIIRTGLAKPQDLEVTLERPSVESVSFYSLEDGFYYLRLRSFKEQAAQELQQALRAMKRGGTAAPRGIILDLRNSAGPQFEEARRLASTFVGGELIYTVKGRQPNSKQTFTGLKDYQVFKERLPLVVLVDHGTGRAAEILAGALQTQYGAVLMGYKTFGDCAVAKVFPLKDGSAIVVSVGFCYTPRDQLIQGKGLEPDIMGPKKDGDEQVETLPAKPEKVKKLPDLQEIRQDPLVVQALAQLKNWGRQSSSRPTPPRSLKKKQVAGSQSLPEELS
ncbi:MAG: S41 family peptidase [Desulfobacca sp.]|uniref:S41 family peptidase n=1 Tax=Desulfobacca sp. TaxID=2067990 RepID=UPI00404A8CB5